MLRRKKLAGVASLLATIALTATACGGAGNEGSGGNGGGGGGTITIDYITWAEDVALSNLYKQVLENKGYDVELQQLEAGSIFASIAQGSDDLFFDVWLPVTHKNYWKRFKDQVEDYGVWYDQATLNLAVPEYVKDVNSIADLKSHADMFDGKITGIDPGAGETDVVKNDVIPQYNLKGTMELQTSSTPTMIAALDKAITAKDPIVVTLWHPHYAYSRWDLKDLKDPKGAMGENEKLHFIGREGFSDDFPSVTDSLKNFEIDDEHLQSLEDTINAEGEDDPAKGVKKWMDKNQDFIDDNFGMIKQAG